MDLPPALQRKIAKHCASARSVCMAWREWADERTIKEKCRLLRQIDELEECGYPSFMQPTLEHDLRELAYVHHLLQRRRENCEIYLQ